MSRLLWFVLGILFTVAVIVGGGYLLLTSGGVPMMTRAAPLPLERTVAHLALRGSYAGAADRKNPLPMNDENMTAGARLYARTCAGCHGLPGRRSRVAHAMFPEPPQLFEKDDMVTDDPEGVTYWKVTNGIRLSGMPAFDQILSDSERWQLSMLLAHADKLPQGAKDALTPRVPQ
jgi:thiosulfate dehydrogenase